MNDRKIMDKLKPCPFCGGEADFDGTGGIFSDKIPTRYVECLQCGASIEWSGTNTKKISNIVKKAWNTRVKEKDNE